MTDIDNLIERLRTGYVSAIETCCEAADALDAYRKQTGGLPLDSGIIAKALARLAEMMRVRLQGGKLTYESALTADERAAIMTATFEVPT